jgi:hypothetical protein
MIKGSGSVQVPLTNGSGSRRPKNIRIHIADFSIVVVRRCTLYTYNYSCTLYQIPVKLLNMGLCYESFVACYKLPVCLLSIGLGTSRMIDRL